MTVSPSPAIDKTRLIMQMIKFEHTIFALPFALISALLAARSSIHGISSGTITWVIMAMIGARSAAMSFNRLADAEIDASNPRTLLKVATSQPVCFPKHTYGYFWRYQRPFLNWRRGD